LPDLLGTLSAGGDVSGDRVTSLAAMTQSDSRIVWRPGRSAQTKRKHWGLQL
jgi:hypothetical protein